jgi:WD40 repeat protein
VALAGHDGSVQLWDVESGKLTASLAGPGKPARCLQFSPDSKLLAAGDERALWVWEVETKTAHEFQDKGMSAVLSTSFSSDRKFLVTSSADKTLRVWNVETRRPEATSRLPIQGVWTGFAPDPKCNLVVFLERDSKHSIAGLWNWRLKRSPAMLADSSGVHCLAFAPDGRKLVGGMDNGTIRSWDLADSDNPQHGYEFDGHIGVVESVVFQSNGRLLASAGADKTFRWWDAESANNLRSWDAPPRTESVFALSFASDGRLLVATARAAEVEIWQIPLP